MKPKYGNYESSNTDTRLKDVKLTEDEINSVEGFSKLTLLEKEDLKDLVYNLSITLYKLFKNESA